MTTILVIEDEEPIRENLVTLLEAEGYEVISAANGRVGVQLARQHLPDLILCDILMPELDGYGVYRELRQDPVTATIPFIFLTARANLTDVRAGMALGADDYLTKPFTREEVLQAIATRLAKRATVVRQFQSKMDELRQSMARMLPHELRTPLTSILGFSSVLIEDYATLPPDEIRGIAESIHRAGQRLYRLVQKFLLYAELELIARDPEQLQALRHSRVTSTALLIENVARQKAQEARRNADLVLDLQDGPAQVAESYLIFMLEELIENAFKFSLAGTSVQVSSRIADEGTLTIAITDRGRGMTPEQIAGVDAYVQFERRQYEQQGPGLGLAIARRIAELHGGKLTIESVPGQQTTVRVVLPLAANGSLMSDGR